MIRKSHLLKGRRVGVTGYVAKSVHVRRRSLSENNRPCAVMPRQVYTEEDDDEAS